MNKTDKICWKEYRRLWIKNDSKNNPWKSSMRMAKQRCNNKNNPYYYRYGGRGIKYLLTTNDVLFVWKRDNGHLLKNHSMDRIDNDGHYEIGNIRFIEQSKNVGRINGEKVYCKRGHRFTPENTLIKANGWRQCKACAKACNSAWYANKKKAV